MVSLKALITLCLCGATVAAPQFGGSRSVSSVSSVQQEEVVSNVVSALGPSIAAAVEQALAAQAAPQRRLATSRTRTVEEPSDPPKYNFEYKVADEQDQTYISQNEIRDGDELTGTYSFVDPRGALITVNYEAGPMGYSETRDEKLDFVQIRSKPARLAPAPAPAPKLDQATLIQRILAMIQPQISEAVNSALSARREAEASRLATERLAAEQAAAARAQAEAAARAQAEAAARARAEAAARAAADAAANTNTLSLFGDGGFNVRVETPNFKIEY